MPPRRAQPAPAQRLNLANLHSELQYLSKTRKWQDVSGRATRLLTAPVFASEGPEILALLANAYGAVGRSIIGTDGANARVWAILGAEIKDCRNPQLSLALLRSDTLSLFAQICAALGKADGGDAAGPSTSSGRGSDTPRGVQVAIVSHIAGVLHSILMTEEGNQTPARSEVLDALRCSQLLEHLTGAILRLAATLPPDVRGSGDPKAALDRAIGAVEPCTAADVEADWACLSLAMQGASDVLWSLVCRRDDEPDCLVPVPHPAFRERSPEGVQFAAQLRPLLSGRSVQHFCAVALQCACLGESAAAGHAPVSTMAPLGAHPLRLDAKPLPAAGTAHGKLGASILWAVSAVFLVTSWGHAQLPIAQPPAGYRPAGSAVAPPAPTAAETAGSCNASTANGNSSTSTSSLPAFEGGSFPEAPYRALPVYELVVAAWCDLSIPDIVLELLLCRLVTELRPRQAAARLPGLWREVLVPEVRDLASAGFGTLVAELLRLQVPAPPLAAGAPQPSARASSYSTYSLRCALDAGLLPALERVLRNEQAWAIGIPHVSDLSNGPGRASSTGPQPGACNAFHMLREINGSLRYSGLWPAALAHAPPEQVVGLVATMTAAARWLSQKPPVMLRGRPLAGRLNKMMPYQGDAMGLLCGNLAALLEQGLDLAEDAAAAEGSAAAARAAREEATVSVAGAPAGSSSHSHRRPYLRLNDALEAPESAPMQWAWLVAAGGTPPAGSAAAAQRDWLLSFAALQWLPLLLEDLGTALPEILKLEEAVADREETAAGGNGGPMDLNAHSLERAVVALRVAGEVLAAAAMAQVDAEEARLRGTDGASGSKGQAAAGRAGADPAQQQQQQQQQQPTSADVLRQTNAQAQHDPTASNLHAELPSNAQQQLESWQPVLVALLDGGHLQQLVGYFATHTEQWAGLSGSSSSDSTGDGTRCGGADNTDADGVGGDGLEGCVLDALEAFCAHRPQALPHLMLSRARKLGQVQAVTAKSGDVGSSSWPGNTDSSCSSGSRNPSDGSSAPAQQVVVHKALWDLSPLREVAARHGRSELVQLIDAASADVAVAFGNADAATAGGEEGVGILVDASCSHLRRRLLRRRYRDAAEGAGGGATGCQPSRAWRLLSPYEVRQQVDAALATAAAAVAPAAATSSAGAASGSGGGGSASVAAAAVAPAALCANPGCSSLDGPSALVPSGGGKTCSRCRVARYCCGLCQLQHWRKGGHATQCPGVVAATAAAGSAAGVGASSGAEGGAA